MEYNYTSQYRVIETFKETEEQNIYIGVKLAEGMPVIINHIKDQGFINALKDEPLGGVLDNLVYVESLEDEFILITKIMEETQPLFLHLEDYYVPIKNRMSMVLQYLKGIIKYDHLNNVSKNILIDEGQLVVVNDKIVFDGLFLLNDDNIDIGFNDLCYKICTVIEKILYFEYKHLKKEELLLSEVQQFIEELKNNEKYLNLQEILDEFRKLYIYHLCMESVDPDIDENTEDLNDINQKKLSAIIPKLLPKSIPTLKSDLRSKSRRNRNTPSKGNPSPKKIAIAAALVLLLGVGAYGLMTNFSLDTILNRDTETQQHLTPPTAFFKTIREDQQWEFVDASVVVGEDNFIEEYQWEVLKDGELTFTSNNSNLILSFSDEGEYTVNIRIRDRYNQWSEKYSENINVGGPEEEAPAEVRFPERSNSITYTFTDGISKEEVIVRNDEYSLKVEKKQNNKPQLTVNTQKTDKSIYDTLTLWIRASSKDQIKINIKAYDKEKLTYQKETIHYVNMPEIWEMLNVNLTNEQLSSIVLEFSDFESVFWIADLHLDTFK